MNEWWLKWDSFKYLIILADSVNKDNRIQWRELVENNRKLE